ncbi:MAG: TIGR01244 family protein [Roseibaca calidilacus]|uniref:TIGR01244 family protein n=1 Tax=Roseibaca calidilacus TaxID=1666912 RepID=A0A0P7YIR1_9RHOB|nr:TIGR01244 family sulfur transferase [Roseibaca calidilacus]KPP90512.1 MAG: TIGR01244 family protein [Roseibaca calidilacus]CUX83337.1 TIGR01244 family protein [Roseibaca calidilacus]
MDIRPLTDGYAVAPQIAAEEAAEIAAAGFKTVICNRPDGEVPAEFQSDAIRAAVEAAGMNFVANPVIGGAITPDNISAQGAAIADQPGPILAYCASGNRSSIVWAMSQVGTRPIDELIATPAQHGYNLEPLRPLLENLSKG